MKSYVGIDSASIGGVAFYNPTLHKALVTELKGNPLTQLIQLNLLVSEVLKKKMANDAVFVFEQLVHFRNAKTVRDLLERSGFLKWTLKGLNFKVAEDIDPNVARGWLQTKDKEGTFRFFLPFYKSSLVLTNNHTDALAIAIYQAHLDGYEPNYEKLTIERIFL
jgi:hypothetical protein